MQKIRFLLTHSFEVFMTTQSDRQLLGILERNFNGMNKDMHNELSVVTKELAANQEELKGVKSEWSLLLEGDPNDVTSATRKLVRQKGQLMTWDAKAKFEQGIISERVYKLIIAGAKDYQQQ